MLREKEKDQPLDDAPSLQKVKISGRFDQYRSSYWAALLPLLSARYIFRPFVREHWEDPKPGQPAPSYAKRHAYSGIVGLFMSGVTSFYAYRTYQDMKSIFQEPLAWEFGKQPEEVTVRDFRRSKNTIIRQTVDNYIKYNLRRFGVNSSFFLPFVFKGFFKKHNLHPETGVDMGIGFNAMYLFSDVLSRKMTPFEELQQLIDRKVNHTDRYGDVVTAYDLLDVYERHAPRGPIDSFLEYRGKPEWEQVVRIFERMADLMNQTYHNATPREKADFGFPKFVYLVGNDMIDPRHMDLSLAGIEIANRDGIPAAIRFAQDVKRGATFEQLAQKYGFDAEKIREGDTPPAEPLRMRHSSPPASLAERERQRRLQHDDAPSLRT